MVLLLCVNQKVQAQEWIYTVHKGDTLWDISEEYLKGTHYWPRLRELNQVANPKKIPPGTRLRIPLTWLKYGPVPVIVVKTQGKCEATSQTKGTYDLRAGARLFASDKIQTGKNSNITLRFADGSKLLMQADTEMVLDTVSAYGKTGMVDTRFRLDSGYIDTQVEPKAGPGSRFEITTPSAVAAVRGTDFRVSAEEAADSMRSEVLAGKVNVKASGVVRSVGAGFGIAVKSGEAPPRPKKLLPPPSTALLPTLQRQLPLQFEWPKLPEALKYRFQIAPSDVFEQLIVDKVITVPEIKIQDLADGEYALRLRGIDNLDLEGLNASLKFSVDARPFAPLPLDPKNNATRYQAQPRFWWSVPEGAVAYHYRLATDREFHQLVEDRKNLDQSFFIPDEPLAPGEYFWQISSLDGSGDEGPYSEIQSLIIKTIPAAPDISDAAIEESQINFRWQPEHDAVSYRFQLSRNADFDDLIIDQPVKENQFSLPQTELEPDDYFFRIRAINSDGVSGPFSVVHKLEIPGEDSPFWLFLYLLPLLLLIL